MLVVATDARGPKLSDLFISATLLQGDLMTASPETMLETAVAVAHEASKVSIVLASSTLLHCFLSDHHPQSMALYPLTP
jgi:hypothetical protein